MKKINLMQIFRTNRDIAEILGSCRQNVHPTVDFTRPKDVKLLLKALDRRFNEIEKVYLLLKEQGQDDLLRAKNDRTKAESKWANRGR